MLILSKPEKAVTIAFFTIIGISLYGLFSVAMFMVVLISGILLYRSWVRNLTL